MTLHLGQAALRGSIEHYAKFFDLFELVAEPGRLPRAGVLRRWRESVPEEFVFSVALSDEVAKLTESSRATDELHRAIGAANMLEAKWLVIRTGRNVTPTSRYRERLRRLTGELLETGCGVAWHAQGIWAYEEGLAFADELDVCWMVDVGRDVPPLRDNVYMRLRSLGSGGQLGAAALERAAERLAECSNASVVVEGRAASIVVRRLRELTEELRGLSEETLPELDEEVEARISS